LINSTGSVVSTPSDRWRHVEREAAGGKRRAALHDPHHDVAVRQRCLEVVAEDRGDLWLGLRA
jgi:hypothetical protein